jgi:hypothetical protein
MYIWWRLTELEAGVECQAFDSTGEVPELAERA